jgi:iron(III) transport system ATP-binding protein
MRSELADLQRRLGLTMLYVTHDQEEALALSHRVALMRDGRLIEVGAPADLFERPRHRFTADFLGLANFLPGTLVRGTGNEAAIDTPFGRFAAETSASELAEPEFFFRPHHATLNPPADTPNSGEGIVADATFLGELVDVQLRRDQHAIRLRMHPTQLPAPGATLRFAVAPRHATLFVPQAVSSMSGA